MIATIVHDFYKLFYPAICGGCDTTLAKGEQQLCFHCRLALPFTQFEKIQNNPVEQLFFGRVPIEFGTALLYFSKAEMVQQIMHNIKYNDKKDLAQLLGKILGERLQNIASLHDVTAIVPVPLHERKLRMRGYNQSECLAEGINEILKVDIVVNGIQRIKHTDSQTNKNMIERWENVKDAFEIKQIEKLKNKHILLVDDVLTTGATLEACALTLIEKANCKVSIATLAFVAD